MLPFSFRISYTRAHTSREDTNKHARQLMAISHLALQTIQVCLLCCHGNLRDSEEPEHASELLLDAMWSGQTTRNKQTDMFHRGDVNKYYISDVI